MPTNQYTPPEHNELEISLFGSGYGEAIALHMGQGNWVLVDSYRSGSKLSASLEYLRDIQVDASKAVKTIIATHWHDDHIKGISDVLRQCTSAEFFTTGALLGEQFHALVGLDYPTGKHTSGLKEFKRILEFRDAETISRAGADRLVYRHELKLRSRTIDAKIYALSPSDKAEYHALRRFAQSFPKEGDQRKRVPDLRPNYCSIVLWVEIGQQKLLLGGDLEVTSDPGTGWAAIIQGSKAVGTGASVFKIPHHGSSNGHDIRVWDGLLCRTPYAILTPYNCGQKPLPFVTDIRRIVGLTPHSYISARIWQKAKQHQSVVRKEVQAITKNAVSKSSAGHIRLRCKLGDPDTSWRAELFGSACSLSKFL